MTGMVIVGAGEAGTRAGFALREQGWQGAITLIGAEDGLPYERPPLSKPMPEGAQRKPVCDTDAFARAGIDYLPGIVASRIDPSGHKVVLADGTRLSYAKLLLATGARPRRIDLPGAERIRDFRTYADAVRVFDDCLPGRRTAIIGAGLIGMELAAVLRGRDIPVDVVEAGPAPLGRAVPPHFAARLHDRHRAAGVRFHFDARILGIDDAGISLADGTHIPADLVIGAVGVVPDTALASAAGLAVGNGILTDAGLRTSAADIFAAGDCAAVADAQGRHMRFESWRNARDQAEHAARSMLGLRDDFLPRPWFWSDQYDLGLQVAGLPGPDHRMVLRNLAGGGELTFYLDDGRLVAAAGLGPGNSIGKDIKLAEMLIAANLRPDPDALTDASINLKALLKSARDHTTRHRGG